MALTWQHKSDNGESHDSYLYPEFPDGEHALGVFDDADAERAAKRGETISVDDVPDQLLMVSYSRDGVYRTRPASEVIGWRVVCSCFGETNTHWLSERLWTRVSSPSQHDIATYRIYAADADVDDVCDEGSDVREAAQRLWRREHINAIDPTASIKAAADQVRVAHDEIDKSVAFARDRGLSWAKIGAAAGISAQAAHERWSVPA